MPLSWLARNFRTPTVDSLIVQVNRADQLSTPMFAVNRWTIRMPNSNADGGVVATATGAPTVCFPPVSF